MSGQNRVKASSVAAFLWMPQFRLSFQHMAHLVPVFMRSVAMVFAGVGLISRNHPALMYGIQGVKPIGFAELMGEAWHTLRTTRATPDQWGLFISVVLMVGFAFAAVAVFMAHLFFGLGAVAQAQIFDHPGGPTDVVPPGKELPAAGSLYNRSVPGVGPGTGDDYGIMFLDKVLRAGANDVGGPLQNATQGLMQIYNSGVLIIAGVMLFWSILSVVVDTAKTGTVGGGRHNMVWAPIRIVFALGLIIPLGTTGFSSGQFMVMKLAEWGNNFGTRAWMTYVNGINSSSLMVTALNGQNPTGLVNQYMNMWLCRIAYNAYEAQVGNGTIAPAQEVLEKFGNIRGGRKTYFGNDTDLKSGCGTITYIDGTDPQLQVADTSNAPGADEIRPAQLAIMNAYTTALNNLAQPARRVACEFAAEFFTNEIEGTPVLYSPLPSGGEICPAGSLGTVNDGVFGNIANVNAMVASFTGTVQPQLNAARNTIQAYIGSADFMDDLAARGWAGMGMWYHRISQMNQIALSFNNPTVSITDGDWGMRLAGDNEHGKKIREVISKYDAWWKANGAMVASVAAPPAQPGQSSHRPANNALERPEQAIEAEGFVSALQNATNAQGMWNTIAGILGFGTGSPFLFDLVEKDNPNTYPLAELVSTGNQIILTGIGVIGGLTLVPIIGAAISAGVSWVPFIGSGMAAAIGNIVQALQSGPAYEFFGTIGVMLIASGALVSYYVPIIPFMRTVFSVLTWIVSVFEAVVMVPIAALSFITTEGEGLGAKQTWTLWLNVLMRPILTVFGFVGALLVFNAFVVFFNDAFATALVTGNSAMADPNGLIDMIVYTLVYVMTIYTAANTAFKMLDLLPNAMARWLGGSADTSFDQSDTAEYVAAATHMLKGAGGGAGKAAMAGRDKAASAWRNRKGGGASDGGPPNRSKSLAWNGETPNLTTS